MNTDQNCTPADIECFPLPTAKPIRAEVGEIVQLNPDYLDPNRRADKALMGKPFRIEKVNPKSLLIVSETGDRIKTDAFMLMPTDATFTESDAPKITLGTPVRLQGKPDIYVVIKTSAGQVYNLAKFGGDDGSFFRGVPAARLTVVDPAEVLR